jgi:hypothetical protein
MKEAAKAAAVLDQPGISEVAKTSGSNDGSVGPSIQALGPPKGVDLIQVSSDLSP